MQQKLSVVPLSNKPKLIISKELQAQIMYHHNKVGNIEWSGALFYEVVSGTIEHPSELVLKALQFHLLDVGTSGYTEYDFACEEFLSVYDEFPDLMTKKMGHIHTHHNMATFFSGTDTDELHENAQNYNYYLSLIVNHASIPCAKIGLVGKRQTANPNISFKGESGNDTQFVFSSTQQNEETVIVEISCDVIYEADEFIEAHYEKIKASKVVVNTNVYTPNQYNNKPFSTHGEFNSNNWGFPFHKKGDMFLVKLLNLDKRANGTLWYSLSDNCKTYKQASIKTRAKILNNYRSNFKGFVQSFYNDGVTPSKTQLFNAACSAKHWLTYHPAYEAELLVVDLSRIFTELIEKYDSNSKFEDVSETQDAFGIEFPELAFGQEDDKKDKINDDDEYSRYYRGHARNYHD